MGRCQNCHLQFQYAPSGPFSIYSHQYYSHWKIDETGFPAGSAKIRTAERLLAIAFGDGRSIRIGGSLLDIGCAHGQLLEAARRLGLQPSGVEISPAAEFARARGFNVHQGLLETAPFLPQSFDFVCLIDVIEHLLDPVGLLRKVRGLVRSDGQVVIMTPDVDSLSARILGSRWPHFKLEHLMYFSRKSLALALDAAGFTVEKSGLGVKFLNLDYAVADLTKYGRVPTFGATLDSLAGWLPESLRELPLPLPSDIYIVGRVAPPTR